MLNLFLAHIQCIRAYNLIDHLHGKGTAGLYCQSACNLQELGAEAAEKAGTVGNEKQRVKYTEQWYAKAVAKRELRRSKVPQPDERSKLSQ